MKKILPVAFLLLLGLRPAVSYAQIFSAVNFPGFPDVITCVDTVPTLSGLATTTEVLVFQGTLDPNNLPIEPNLVAGYSNNDGNAFFTADGLYQFGSLGCPSDMGYTSITDFQPYFQFGGPSTSTTPVSSTYSPTEQEFLFILGLFLFIGSVPFWERVLSVSRSKYDSWT